MYCHLSWQGRKLKKKKFLCAILTIWYVHHVLAKKLTHNKLTHIPEQSVKCKCKCVYVYTFGIIINFPLDPCWSFIFIKNILYVHRVLGNILHLSTSGMSTLCLLVTGMYTVCLQTLTQQILSLSLSLWTTLKNHMYNPGI